MPELTIQQAVALAIKLHQAGNLSQAEEIYRQILIAEPTFASVHSNLGVLLNTKGDFENATTAFEQAIKLQPDYAIAHSNLGFALANKMEFERSVVACQKAISLDPNLADAHNNLGGSLKSLNRPADAAAAFRRAIDINPQYALAYCNLAAVLTDQNLIDDAIAACNKAVAIDPNLPQAQANLGNALKAAKRFDEATHAFRRAIALGPDSPDGHNNLGVLLADQKLFDDAIAAFNHALKLRPLYPEAFSNLAIVLADKKDFAQSVVASRRAIELAPKLPEAYNNLGIALHGIGQVEEAIAAHLKAIELKSNYPEAYYNLGNIYKTSRKVNEAIAAYRQAIALRPSYPDAFCNLGIVFSDVGEFEQSISAYRKAIQIRDDFSKARNNLGVVLKATGQLDESIASFRTAFEFDRSYVQAHSNVIYTLHFQPGSTAKTLLEEHRAWSQIHSQPLTSAAAPHQNDRNPTRRLKIGYLSPDFRDHCQSMFTVPLLSHHDHDNFEIHAYSYVTRPDAFTDRIRKYCDQWHDVAKLSDNQIADQIRNDQIDLLIDLTIHMADCRPLVPARKPAPVQISWLAYPGISGISGIDYRLTDPYLETPDFNPNDYTEQTLHSPRHLVVLRPPLLRSATQRPPRSSNPIASPSAASTTSAKSTNPSSTSGPRSSCRPRFPPPPHRPRRLKPPPHHPILRKQKHRPRPHRLFADLRPRAEYLQTYHRIDLGLDTFPYNGHTTSLDSFWMGVPVISLSNGQIPVARAGISLLSNLGLQDLSAKDPADFVRIAKSLATDLPRTIPPSAATCGNKCGDPPSWTPHASPKQWNPFTARSGNDGAKAACEFACRLRKKSALDAAHLPIYKYHRKLILSRGCQTDRRSGANIR